MTPLLSILTVSRHATPTVPFEELGAALKCEAVWVHAPSAGTIEHVLDDAIRDTTGDYILRLDDDEWVSPPLLQWLQQGYYQLHPHWKFPRVHRWPTDLIIVNGPLYPDFQTRLSVRLMAGGRHVLHAGSPFGGGVACLFPIVHDKFLKPYAERLALGREYDQIMEGAGTGPMRPFTLPEDEWAPNQLDLAPCPWRRIDETEIA